MRIDRRRALTILAAVAPAAAFAPGAPRAVWHGRVMGAEAKIITEGENAAPALAAARDALHRVEAAFSLFDPGSELSRLNAEGRLRTPSAAMLALVAQADRLHRLTGGAFDPSVQPLWRLMAETRGRPDPAALRAAHARIGWRHLRVAPEEIAFARPGMALTFNGIAQGFAADRAAAALGAHGISHALVNAGEFRGLGAGWRLGSAFGPLEPATGGAAATSAPGALRLGSASHILGPFRESALGFDVVTVLAPEAALADGLSTALCVAGPGGADAILSRAQAEIRGLRAIGRCTLGRVLRWG